VGAALVALLLVAAGSTWGATGIKLCVPKKEGSAVLTPKHGVCKKRYRLRNLGVEGKAGPEGKAGAEGKTGAEGKAGFTAAEAAQLKSLLPYIKFVGSGVGGQPTIQFSGVNVQVLNGTGSEESSNGKGNLVVGYDAAVAGITQTGSHNLVLGQEQSFTSFGGLLAGYKNTVSAPWASVSGGYGNTASGPYSSVSAGETNHAANVYASVSGGYFNTASGAEASVSGGGLNAASGEASSVTGGEFNSAKAAFSTILGGRFQEAIVAYDHKP
jgi:hypothetical protein